MPNKAQFQHLFAYHWHTNQHLLDTTAKLDPAACYEKPAGTSRSAHELLFHIFRTDRGWRGALETGRWLAAPETDFPDLSSLQAAFQDEQQAWQTFLDSLTDQDIDGDATLYGSQGEHVPTPRWRVLQHLLFHGMQHHTELAHLLTLQGYSPGDIDFIFYEG